MGNTLQVWGQLLPVCGGVMLMEWEKEKMGEWQEDVCCTVCMGSYIERRRLRWLEHLFQMTPEHLLGNVFQACTTERKSQGRDSPSRLLWCLLVDDAFKSYSIESHPTTWGSVSLPWVKTHHIFFSLSLLSDIRKAYDPVILLVPSVEHPTTLPLRSSEERTMVSTGCTQVCCVLHCVSHTVHMAVSQVLWTCDTDSALTVDRLQCGLVGSGGPHVWDDGRQVPLWHHHWQSWHEHRGVPLSRWVLYYYSIIFQDNYKK